MNTKIRTGKPCAASRNCKENSQGGHLDRREGNGETSCISPPGRVYFIIILFYLQFSHVETPLLDLLLLPPLCFPDSLSSRPPRSVSRQTQVCSTVLIDDGTPAPALRQSYFAPRCMYSICIAEQDGRERFTLILLTILNNDNKSSQDFPFSFPHGEGRYPSPPDVLSLWWEISLASSLAIPRDTKQPRRDG